MRRTLITVGLISFACIAYAGIVFFSKYRMADSMLIPIEEVTSIQYSEDPANRSVHYDHYADRQLKLMRRDGKHFDFIFESQDPDVATIALKNIDLSLIVPVVPEWVKKDNDLEIISLVDREWNRQQTVFFRDSSHLEIHGGDGFEASKLYSVELARNCLNAGMWEILLFTKEDDRKSLYYHGWFTFPLGHYKSIFEGENGISYWKHWFRLEHWLSPEGTYVNLDKLRTIEEEVPAQVMYDPQEAIFASGEQAQKARIMSSKGIKQWKDFADKSHKISFATFTPPGRYTIQHPWGNEYDRFAQLNSAYVRSIDSPAAEEVINEIELNFQGKDKGNQQRLIISGIDLHHLPKLPKNQYPRGIYMPMGSSVPPVYQTYESLQERQPQKTAYFSVLVDDKGRWLNYHEIGLDGIAMHRDIIEPLKIHLYLLSYERQSLIGHYVLSLDQVPGFTQKEKFFSFPRP